MRAVVHTSKEKPLVVTIRFFGVVQPMALLGGADPRRS